MKVRHDITADNRPFRHFPALDGIRGIAVLVVMVYHLALLSPSITMFVKGGFLGVDIFFVLSGFLISSILITEYERTGAINLKRFYIRRTLRLIPAFWFFLIVLYLFGPELLGTSASTIYANNNFIFAVTYLMNWHSAVGIAGGSLNHTWSLAIEEQFYIIWSLILFRAFAKNISRKQIVLGTSILIVFLILQRGIRAAFGTNTNILYYSTDTRIDAILIGCVASMVYCWRIIPDGIFRSAAFGRAAYISAIIAASIFAIFSFGDQSLYYGPISLFAASIGVIILWLVSRERTVVHRILETSLLRWVGQISYGLYLWHYVFYEFALKTFEPGPARIAAGIVFGFSAASLSYYLVEKPVLALKDRLGEAKPIKQPAAEA